MTTETDSTAADPGAGGVPTLRVRGPGDLAQAIPYLLGFHPEQSLVLVGLDRHTVTVTARFDLADVARAGLLRDSVAGMRRGGANEFVSVVFDDEVAATWCAGDGLPWDELVRQVARAVECSGGELVDAALVSGRRIWSYLCSQPLCCPPEGRELSGRDGSTVAAAATYAGLVALPDRASVARLLDPLPAQERDRLDTELAAAEQAALVRVLDGDRRREDRSVKRALFAACRGFDALGSSKTLDDQQLARFAVALRRYQVRDAAWIAMDENRVDGRVLWRYLARRLPAPYDAAPLFLFGWRSYRDGDGALASMAAQRALSSDPGYSAADLLLAALSQAVDPRRMPRLRSHRPA